MRKLTRRDAIRGAAYVGGGLVLGSGLGALTEGCEPADPEPNERAELRHHNYTSLAPARMFGWKRSINTMDVTGRRRVVWSIKLPPDEWRKVSKVDHRTFILYCKDYEDQDGNEGIVGHSLDVEVTRWPYPGLNDVVDVWADPDALPEGWEDMPLWIHESGTMQVPA